MTPTLEDLRRLAVSDDVRDRAFAAGAIAIQPRSVEIFAIYMNMRAHALAVHQETRARIRDGRLRGAALRARIEAEPVDAREHWVEEVLDVAYPPLDEDPPSMVSELVPYVPSGVREILHALDVTNLGPHHTFVDVGAGLGKVALLARLLTGARVRGIERNAELVHRAKTASAALDPDVLFTLADAREAELVGDVFYLYTPFTGTVLAAVLNRLERLVRPFQVCAQTLDLARHPWLRDLERPCSWLNVYVSR